MKQLFTSIHKFAQVCKFMQKKFIKIKQKRATEEKKY